MISHTHKESTENIPCLVKTLGITDYRTAFSIQNTLFERVLKAEIHAALIIVEHPHVYTLGRRSKEEDILLPKKQLQRMGVEVIKTNRGGATSYHGPGQIVAYPIINLRSSGISPVEYVRLIEDTLITTLKEFNILGTRKNGMPGVWINDLKIAAIGVRISKGITTHGFSLNVSSNLNYFDHIINCSSEEMSMTSIKNESPLMDANIKITKDIIVKNFCRKFNFDLRFDQHPKLF